jgi:hypothetical protein
MTATLPVLFDPRDVWALAADRAPAPHLPAFPDPPTLEELLADCSQPTNSPYLMYLRSLPSPRSQATMASAVRTLLAQLSPELTVDPLTFTWHRLTAKETSASGPAWSGSIRRRASTRTSALSARSSAAPGRSAS